MSSGITAIDLFCGAGGSSTGLVAAGVEVKTAVNHWQLAIETHATNHPDTDHDCADIRLAHPSLYPRTTIFWASPECTNHSLSKGKKRKNISQLDLWGNSQVDPAEERSRATMREVVEFAAYHRHEFVIVENVVDIRYWEHYDSWLMEMTNLGYEHKALYINAQFFGVPQSRDRIYIVFWRKGNKAPDLDFRPTALCEIHGRIEAVQSWKKPDYQWGRYGSRRQYVYRCPHCAGEVMPFYTPAAAAIDWAIPSQKIGDRKTPLKPKTIERILAGLKKFGSEASLVDVAYEGGNRNYAVDVPMPTQTTRQTMALLTPYIVELRKNGDGRSLEDALATIVSSAQHHSLITPPFLAVLRGTANPTSMDEPISTIIASASQHAIITPFLTSVNNFDDIVRDIGEPLPTQTTANKMALTVPPFLTSQHNNKDGSASRVSGIDQPMPYLTTFNNEHQLVIPPFLTSTNHSSERNDAVTAAMPTVMPQVRRSLVTPPIIAAYYGNDWTYAAIDTPMPTQTTVQRHALISPEDILPECGFRMLEPHELQRGMSFPDEYIILGNKKEKVRQIGNAVCPNVAQAIAQRCVESLS